MSDNTEILKTIQNTLKEVMTQQATLMRMYDTTHLKFTELESALNKFKKEWKVKKSIQNCIISQDLLSCGQNDMIFAINKLTDEFNQERRQTESRISALQQEVAILTQLFIHGDDIKTYDLSTTFPEAYGRIVELEKQRAKTRPWRPTLTNARSVSSDEEMSDSVIPPTSLANKEL